MINPDRTTYLKDAAVYRVIPVFKELRAEFETPLSVYLKSGGMFLLESIERGENVGRYSIIACGRKAVITLRGRRIEIRENGQAPIDTESANPLENIRDYFAKLKAPAYDGLPPFFGGAIGYFLWTFALTHLSPTQVAVYVNLNPMIATLLGATLLAEKLTGIFFASFAAVLAGVLLVNLPGRAQSGRRSIRN